MKYLFRTIVLSLAFFSATTSNASASQTVVSKGEVLIVTKEIDFKNDKMILFFAGQRFNENSELPEQKDAGASVLCQLILRSDKFKNSDVLQAGERLPIQEVNFISGTPENPYTTLNIQISHRLASGISCVGSIIDRSHYYRWNDGGPVVIPIYKESMRSFTRDDLFKALYGYIVPLLEVEELK